MGLKLSNLIRSELERQSSDTDLQSLSRSSVSRLWDWRAHLKAKIGFFLAILIQIGTNGGLNMSPDVLFADHPKELGLHKRAHQIRRSRGKAMQQRISRWKWVMWKRSALCSVRLGVASWGAWCVLLF